MTGRRTATALRCDNVSKSYPVQEDFQVWRVLLGAEDRGRVIQALTDVSLEVPRGKIVGILGRNGAGKSTLLRVLGGVYQPNRGKVEVHGTIAALFEMGGVGNPNLTGRAYASRYLRIMGAARSEIGALLEDIKDFSELGDAFDHRVRTYSSGMGARLYFATATASQHEIYLIDELLSVGDEHFQAKCWVRMRQRLLQGASGVLVTHDWESILRLCEQSHVIERGRLTFSGPSDQAVVSYLKIPRPDANVARISPRNPHSFVAYSGQDTGIPIFVDVLEPAQVDIAISVEKLRIGVGWEIILLTDGLAVADEPGTYAVNVFIPRLPLSPGTYSFNVFLSRRKQTPLDTAVGFDCRTWTLGNGLELKVVGEESQALVRLPFAVHRAGEVA